MGVTCHILIKESKQGVYYAGETVSGIIKYNIDKPTEFQRVILSLLGDGKCKWAEERGDTTDYHHGKEEYIAEHINISKEKSIIQKGLYEYPFEFILPDNIPSTFKSKECTIRYRIRVKFEKSNIFSFNEKFNAEIPVCGFVEPTIDGAVQFGLDKSLFKLFSMKNHLLKLKGVLVKTCLYPGEDAQMDLRIINDTDEKPTVQVNLYCCTTLLDKKKKSLKRNEKIKGCYTSTDKIQKHSDVRLFLTVPTNDSLHTIDYNILKKEYTLKVEVVLPAFHRNAVLNVPVVIGKRKGDSLPTYQNNT